MILLYLGIFLALTLLMASTGGGGGDLTGFQAARIKTAFVAAESTPLVAGLKEALAGVATFVPVKDDGRTLQDALFTGALTCILRIPEGFTRAFMEGKFLPVEKTAFPSEMTARYLDMAVEQYLRIAGLYRATLPGMDEATIVRHTLENLAGETEVHMRQTSVERHEGTAFSRGLFNYLGYGLLSVLILGIGHIMLVFNTRDLRLRNACAPVASRSMQLQVFTGIGVFTLVCWAVMAGFCSVFQRGAVHGTAMLFFLANSLLLAFWGAGFGFFIGQLVKGRSAISAITSVAALGMSFIGGVFVPQALLTPGVLQAAGFTPTYWFVLANERIAALGTFSMDSLGDVFSAMGMQFGFGLAFLGLALAAGKRKQTAA